MIKIDEKQKTLTIDIPQIDGFTFVWFGQVKAGDYYIHLLDTKHIQRATYNSDSEYFIYTKDKPQTITDVTTSVPVAEIGNYLHKGLTLILAGDKYIDQFPLHQDINLISAEALIRAFKSTHFYPIRIGDE